MRARSSAGKPAATRSLDLKTLPVLQAASSRKRRLRLVPAERGVADHLGGRPFNLRGRVLKALAVIKWSALVATVTPQRAEQDAAPLPHNGGIRGLPGPGARPRKVGGTKCI
ncbi:hypothetical protein SKAU_G00344380 [Synaphobranchus kaupii]|uniref:Uncharacterized protein n=1 Tax=Synaphobranchus kaupii TaxID=118154 RepID=A0A9Q1EJB9_SYNKA|nr:hypothetical protein SKAU_G00344380 [Synaphobranchus kaupii]